MHSENGALQRLITTESQRVQAACLSGTTATHFAAQTSIAEPSETTRYVGDSPGSCFVAVTARTTAWAGGHRDPTLPRGVTARSCSDLTAGKFRKFSFSGEREHRCKKQGPPTLMSRELPCAVVRTSWAKIMKITTLSEFAPPPLAFALLLLCPRCLTAGTCGREGQFPVLSPCYLERSRFSVPCDDC